MGFNVHFFHTFLIIQAEVKIISKSFDKKQENLINEDIMAPSVLVISETGEQLGVMDRLDALKIAEDRGYDLVCVAPNAPTPVCKLLDYSKYRYDQIKKAKEAKKNQKIISVKEVRLSPTIDVGDFNTKLKAARKFLSDGDKVKVSCRFRGRMIEHANKTKELFLKFAVSAEDISTVEVAPYMEGRNMLMMLAAIPDKKKK